MQQTGSVTALWQLWLHWKMRNVPEVLWLWRQQNYYKKQEAKKDAKRRPFFVIRKKQAVH